MKAVIIVVVLSLLLLGAAVFCAEEEENIVKPAVRAEDIALVILSLTPSSQPTIKEADVSKIDPKALVSYQKYLENLPRPTQTTQLSDSQIDYAQILNFAKQAWVFIEKNKAVSNYQTHYANALPRGVGSAFDLHSWSAPQARSYNVKHKNLLGITILDLTYTVTYIPGGKANNVGAYLDHITIIPTNVFVQWGWTFNAQVNVRSITNAGTQSSPIAAATVELNYKLSALNSQETTESFYVRGDGAFQWINRRGF